MAAERTSSEKASDVFAARYTLNRGILPPSLQRVADYINANQEDVVALSAIDIAHAIGLSDATVVRAVKALGFEGLSELRKELLNSRHGKNAPAANFARTLEDVGESAEVAMASVFETLTSAIEPLNQPPFRAKLTEALKILHVADRIVLFGLGPTAHIAAYCVTRLRREGRKSILIDRAGEQIADTLLELEGGDAILMLSYGNLYREAEATLSEARRLGVPLVLISDSTDPALLKHAKVVLNVPRGRSMQIALHGATLVSLEMLLLGLATSSRDATTASLARLEHLRGLVRQQRQRQPPVGR